MPDTAPTTVKAAQPRRELAGAELILMIAALMAINALSIDVMLPALPQIASGLHVTNANDRQLVIVVYMLASGVAQLAYGPLADAYGRRPVLLGALAVYLCGATVCVTAGAFPLFLVGRAIQGISLAAT